MREHRYGVMGFLLAMILVSCGVKSHANDDAPVAPPSPELKLDSSAVVSEKTVPNPAAVAPFTHSLIQSFTYESAADGFVFLKVKSSSHGCQSGDHFEGPLLSISKTDGSSSKAEEVASDIPVLKLFRLHAFKGTNKITVQFNSEGVCSVQWEFSLVAAAPGSNIPPVAIDPELIGSWNKSETNHSHHIVANLDIKDGGSWSSKVLLNDAAVYDIDFAVRTNTTVTPHQLELTVREVHKPSKENPENPGDTFHCLYQVQHFASDSELKMYCLAKGETFYPTSFVSDQVEFYHSGDNSNLFAVLLDRSDLNLSIPDNSTTGVNATFEITDDGLIGDLSIAISLKHTRLSEVQIYLVDPQGNSMLLNESALTSGDVAFGRGGIANPLLSALRGKAGKGIWTLKFMDRTSGDVGVVQSIRVLNYR